MEASSKSDKPVPALKATEYILEAHKHYQYWGMVVYGWLRCGKSSYCIRLLSEVYGETYWDTSTDPPRLMVAKRNWDAWKEYMVFFPEDFFKQVSRAQNKNEQQKLIVWDDAGLWASQYRWAEEFAKRLSEYMNVIASDFASVVFTTPDPRWLLKYIRDLPGGHNGRPAKVAGGVYHQYYRYMNIYEGWLAPDLRKYGVKAIAREQFNIKLPDPVFKEYDGVRRSYARIAKDRCIELLHQMRYNKPSREYAKMYEKQMEAYGLDAKEEEKKPASV